MNNKLNGFDIVYFRARVKDKANSILIRAFKESGMTISQLAYKAGLDRDKLINAFSSSYVDLDLISDILLACGKEVEWKCRDIPKREQTNAINDTAISALARF